MFGINDGESFSTAVNFANNFGLTYPVLFDQGGTVYSSYVMSGISPYPRDVIIDQNGIIAYMHSEYDPQYMLKTVNDLLVVNNIDDEFSESLPQKFDIEVFPNPFNPTTNISFTVIESRSVNIEIFNVLGEQVYSEIHNNLKAGSKRTIILNMLEYSSGLYLVKLTNGKHVESKKLVLLR